MCSWLKCTAFLITLISALADANGVKYYLDYYWRDFNGDIPADAVTAGTSKIEHVYIGQALAKADIPLSSIYGEIPLTLAPNQTRSYAPLSYPVPVEHAIKILCSASPVSLKWIQSSYDTFENDIIEHKAVHGGEEYVKGERYSLMVGRTTTEKGTAVGKIVIVDGVAVLRYAKGGIVQTAYTYDLLVHSV